MKLFHSITKLGASLYWVQLGHRKTAIEYAIRAIGEAHTKDKAASHDDPLLDELTDVMRDWVIETLIQGAYPREYHIWEKDTNEYFANQLTRNNDARRFPLSGGSSSYVEKVKEATDLFTVEIPDEIFDEIDSMRKKANMAKHEPGLHVEHFVTKPEYHSAVAAVEAFWETLCRHEQFKP
jgi:hypothetical protein